MNTGTLTFFCGKMGAGKSTAANQLAKQFNAVLLSEDEWLDSLYPDQINTFDDYIKYAARIKPLVKQHVQSILQTGISVVMDFPANTVMQRAWLLSVASEVKAEHEMVYLRVSDEQCLRQIAKRRQEQPERSAFDTEAVFHQVTRYFEAPVQSEGIKLREITSTA